MFNYIDQHNWKLSDEEVNKFGKEQLPVVKELLEKAVAEFLPNLNNKVEVELEDSVDLCLYVPSLGLGLQLCVGEVPSIGENRQFPGWRAYGIVATGGGYNEPPMEDEVELGQYRSPL